MGKPRKRSLAARAVCPPARRHRPPGWLQETDTTVRLAGLFFFRAPGS
jgi:hypothetical protein